MRKRILLAIVGLLVIAGVLAGIKFLQIRRMMAANAEFSPPPETVTTAPVQAQAWTSRVIAVGSLEAVQGVTVAAELPGRIVEIAFTPGTQVQAGELLLRQDTSTERAELPGAEAAVRLARLDFERRKGLLDQRLVSQSEYDRAEASYREALAATESIRTAIAKKTIRAPFAGRLGIRLVDLGQMLREGDAIVSLQALDPIFVNFQVPQQQLPRLGLGKLTRVTSDALPGEEIRGRITAINPEFDAATRNVRVQATVANPQEQLRPGMYVTVAVEMPQAREVVVIPATAVLYAPYGDSVFVVEEKRDDNAGDASTLVATQKFVRLGEKRGDLIAVLSGVAPGEAVVSTGVFKLRNGQSVVIDNTLAPDFKTAPTPEEG